MGSRCFSLLRSRHPGRAATLTAAPACLSAIQSCIQQLSLGLLSPHREARLRRRELRQRQQAEAEDLGERMKQLQASNENKQRQLEEMRKVASAAKVEKTNESIRVITWKAKRR